MCLRFFFFNDTATTEIYTLSLHDALPIFFKGDDGSDKACSIEYWEISLLLVKRSGSKYCGETYTVTILFPLLESDRKSTRLNSSHQIISYAVFCLKKKNIHDTACAYM